MASKAYAAAAAGTPLAPFEITRRTLGAHDVHISIAYCGVCHSDIHQARDEWGRAIFPMVPGHEIVGKVTHTGASVSRFAVGDGVGVGYFVDSCRTCPACRRGLEQYCETHLVATYNARDKDGAPTYGGYSTDIVVDQRYVLKVDPRLPLAAAAPLLCAGITTYSPLRHWRLERGQELAVVGLGGLGHMAVKLGVAMGARVTVLSSSRKKEADARRLGAHEYLVTDDKTTMKRAARRFALILDTVSAEHDLGALLATVGLDGTMVLLGVPEKPALLGAGRLISGRRQLAGSEIGGIAETQEMLDFCAERAIVADIELIAMKEINAAYERMLAGDVRYRFVIDTKTLLA